jgi:hypothetical protein
MQRKTFLKSSLIGLSGLVISPTFGTSFVKGNSDHLAEEQIKEFVVAGHNDLAKVKQMLAKEPNLIYARYDWGKGDFEEAIEGAGHVGNKEIANYLIENGARVNLFVLTMLGKKKIVIPALEEYPNLITAKGPHGLSLLHHAQKGGSDAKEIYDFLIDKGLTETKFDIK